MILEYVVLTINLITGFLIFFSALFNLKTSIRNRRITKILKSEIEKVQQLEEFLLWPEIKKKQ